MEGGTPPIGVGQGGQASGGTAKGGSMGGSEASSITRLFSLAVFGFIAAAIKERLKFALDNRRKSDLILWSMWLIPELIYFSFTTGLFHPYYITMLAPPIASKYPMKKIPLSCPGTNAGLVAKARGNGFNQGANCR